jgi:hypothetical protein
MDTNNDSSQGAVPANSPVPAGRPNQYIGYSARSVQPPIVAPRPNAFTSSAANPPIAPVTTPVGEPIAPVVETPAFITPSVEAAPAIVTPVDPINVVEPTAVVVETPAVAVPPEYAPEELVAAEEVPSPGADEVLDPEMEYEKSASEPPEQSYDQAAESIPVTVDATPAADMQEQIDPVVQETPAAPEEEDRGEAIQVAITPAPSTEPIAESPIVQMPPVESITTAVPVVPAVTQPTQRPSLAQPAGVPIDDFRVAPAAPAPVAASAPVEVPVAPAAEAQMVPPTPSAPTRPGFSDVITPQPARPFAIPPGGPGVIPDTAQTEVDLEAKTDTDHITNHLEAQAQPKKHKTHFGFLHRHAKVAAAALVAFVILGGGGGFYLTQSGVKANPNVVATWVAFNDKNAGFTAKYVQAPKHVKLNSGDGYVRTESYGEYGVRDLDPSTSPDAVIAADAVNYGNGKIAKQSYKTVSGADATSGTITGTFKGQPALVTFQFLVTSKDLYELYTVGYGTTAAPNTQYFFTTFKPTSAQ